MNQDKDKKDKKNYFQLVHECYLVKGKKNGAIYNVLSGGIFALNAVEQAILMACEDNEPINRIPAISAVSQQEVNDFLAQVEENQLGMFMDYPVYVEKYRDRTMMENKGFFRNPPLLQTAFLELEQPCDLACSFCQDPRVRRRWACLGCSVAPPQSAQALNSSHWEQLLNQLHQLECQRLVIGGGNPLVRSGPFKNIVATARSLSFKEILVVTNAVNMDPGMSDFLQENSVHPVIQVVSHNARIFDAITQQPGGFNRLVNHLEDFKRRNISFSIVALALDQGEPNITATVNYFQAFLPKSIIKDYLYLSVGKGRGISVKESAAFNGLLNQNRAIPCISVEQFLDNKQFNPCLNGKIAVTARGDILPCPEMRDQIMGNIKTQTIQNIFSQDAPARYWELSKEKIQTCKICEFRYACRDCRALEMEGTGNLTAMKYCGYDSGSGEWLSTIQGERARTNE